MIHSPENYVILKCAEAQIPPQSIMFGMLIYTDFTMSDAVIDNDVFIFIPEATSPLQIEKVDTATDVVKRLPEGVSLPMLACVFIAEKVNPRFLCSTVCIERQRFLYIVERSSLLAGAFCKLWMSARPFTSTSPIHLSGTTGGYLQMRAANFANSSMGFANL